MLFTKKDAPERLFLCSRMNGMPQGGRKPVWLCSRMRRTDICSCNICTSTIPGGRMPQGGRMAVRIFLFCFTSLLAISNTAWAEPACPADSFDETTTVRYIHDGDTLHLKDGRKVRLIGINTPEASHGTRAAELFSAEASNSLKSFFEKDKTISLLYGEENQDRYKRTLAHVFSSDGTNLQAALLNKGLAYAITFPPNTRFIDCYQKQEREARCNKRGLWKKTKPLKAKKLNDTHIGFKLVKGKVTNININKKGVWLSLNDMLTIGIRPDNQQHFDLDSIYKMLNQTIIVHGWLNKNKAKNKDKTRKYDAYYIRIRHPSAIQLADAFNCR